MARVLGVCALFSHGIAAEFNAIGGLYKSIQDGVCERGIRHGLVPVFDGYLACGNGRAFLDSIIQNLEEVFFLRLSQRTEPPIVQHEDIRFFEFVQDSQISAISPGNA